MKIESMTAEEYRNATLNYASALKNLNVMFETINDEFISRAMSNPIEHIKSRLKTTQSIIEKLKKRGWEPTWENAVKYVDDIAGIRIICSFTTDIYRIATVIEAQKHIRVLMVKDYITNPKTSGYRSYHMLIEVPVYLSARVERVKVEVQIRTIAMDFWASLEHKMRYKYKTQIPMELSEELNDCANIVSFLDERMTRLNEEIEK
ncbi:MAG: GTP pyrophosphokinase family protein [Clostridia bacterium]|nr:GTP pyrophosphokinase family protein [Clostridia bacterium]